MGFKSLKDAQQYNAENLHGSKSIREEFIKRLEKKKKLANEISEIFRIDGEKIIIQENAIGEFDKAGKLINIRGYLFDITERVKAERELVKLSTAVEQSPVSIVITDTNGTIEYVNPIFGKITGYSLEETIGQNPRILKSGVYGESEYRKLWKTITNGKIWVGEFLNKKKNGELYWESATISPVVGKEGKTTHYLAVKEDITEQKNNISELMDREEKYRTLTQNLNTGVYRNTPGKNGRFLEANPAFIKMFDFRNRNELDRFKVADLYPDPAERKIIEKKLNLKGFLINEEIQLRKKDGTLFYASISATVAKNEIGAVMHYDGIIEDITERKTMLNQIIKERDKSQLYLDIAGVMFLALDRRGNILLANQKTCEIVGVKEEDLIGNNWADSYLPKDIRLDVKNVFNKLINDKSKSAKFFENEIITANGEKRLISWHNNNLLDESGNIYGIISSGLDITEQKEAEELREKLYETSRYLTESLDINIVLKQISNQAMSLLKCSRSMVYMLDDDNKTINPVMAYYPPYSDKVMSTKLSIDNSLTGQTVKAKTGKIFNYNDNVKGAHHIQGTPEEDRDNIIISPFIIDGKVIGTLNLIRLELPFNEKDLKIVNTFAIYASTAIKNAENHQQLQHEIDERLQTEELLKESHNRYESIFDGAADGIIYTDWDGNIISVNPAAENLLDTSKEKMVGNNAIEMAKSLMSGESLDRMLEFIKKTLMGEVISDFLVKTDKKEFEFDTPRKKEKLGITIMIRDVTERNKSRTKLVVHQNNLQLLTNELTMAEEKARRRLAITLHDKLGQALVLAKFKTDELMKLTKDSKQNKVIDEITTFLEEAIKESRNITYELSPPVLYEMGLVSAVSWKLEEIEKSNKLKTSLIDGSKSYKFEKREEIILYRAINELLQNTIKHAKAKIVNISFRLLKNNYRITVSDDGVGFNLEMMKNMAISDKKFGIFSIMERIRYVGGEVTIDTALKKGTKIIINMPTKN